MRLAGKVTFWTLVAAALTASAGAGRATEAAGRTEASAEARVTVTVVPVVAVAPDGAVVDAGSIARGDFSATVRFHVLANQPSVWMYVQASPMHQAGDAGEEGRPPIPVNLSAPAVIAPREGREPAPEARAGWIGPGERIEGRDTSRTETVAFGPTASGGFNQRVHVTVTWTQDDPRRPPGRYDGIVRLTVMLLP